MSFSIAMVDAVTSVGGIVNSALFLALVSAHWPMRVARQWQMFRLRAESARRPHFSTTWLRASAALGETSVIFSSSRGQLGF